MSTTISTTTKTARAERILSLLDSDNLPFVQFRIGAVTHPVEDVPARVLSSKHRRQPRALCIHPHSLYKIVPPTIKTPPLKLIVVLKTSKTPEIATKSAKAKIKAKATISVASSAPCAPVAPAVPPKKRKCAEMSAETDEQMARRLSYELNYGSRKRERRM